MTREDAGRKGREMAARARAQRNEYYTDGNTVRQAQVKQNIGKKIQKNKARQQAIRQEAYKREQKIKQQKQVDFQIAKERLEEKKRKQEERLRQQKKKQKEQAIAERERALKARENRHRTPEHVINKNRENAKQMKVGFVIFMAFASIAVLFSCIHYLQLKSELTYKMQMVANMESELEELREYNNAYENEVLNSVDLNTIKQVAMSRLGMKYPDTNQVQDYETKSSGYLRQYQVVGDDEE